MEKRTGLKLRIKKALVLDVKVHGGKEVPDEVLTTDKDEILEDPEIQKKPGLWARIFGSRRNKE